MNQEQEIKLLKATARALYKLAACLIVVDAVPEWVFDDIKKAQDFYGEDLTKIKLRGRK